MTTLILLACSLSGLTIARPIITTLRTLATTPRMPRVQPLRWTAIELRANGMVRK